MTGDETLRFRLLGPLEAIVNEQPVALAGQKQRALLALLLLHANEPVSRDRLTDELWRDQAAPTSANALAALVARLRRVLPRNVLVTRPGGYELIVEPDAIDIHRFERLVDDGSRRLASGDAERAAEQLRSALGLWRAPPLSDLAYEPFAEPVIRRLDELRLIALENRIDADLALGRHAELVAELQSLILQNPLRERLRGQLMLALYRSGRQTEALAAYRDARRSLTEEVGVEPSEELRRLERAILVHEPALELAPTSGGRSNESHSFVTRATAGADRRLVIVATLILVAFVAIAVAAWNARPNSGRLSSAGGKIAFAAPAPDAYHLTDPSDLYVVNADGSNRRVLARCPIPPPPRLPEGCSIRALGWSPDGSRLAFVRSTLPGRPRASARDQSLLIVGPDGEPARRLAGCGKPKWPYCALFFGEPVAWAPDGSRLVVSRARNKERPGLSDWLLHIIEVDRGIHRRLTPDCGSRRCIDTYPAWAPDGSKIAFARTDGPRSQSVYSVRPDGSDLKRLTDPRVWAGNPAWSPDGRRIAFDVQHRSGNRIYVMAADGSDQRLLASGSASGGTHAWSPDGTRIVYVATPHVLAGVVAELWLIRLDGALRKRLYRSDYYFTALGRPVWSPDGERIAFGVGLEGDPEDSGIFVVNADGTGITRLASAPTDPMWQPIP